MKSTRSNRLRLMLFTWAIITMVGVGHALADCTAEQAGAACDAYCAQFGGCNKVEDCGDPGGTWCGYCNEQSESTLIDCGEEL